jgi:hypothetical protein
VSKLCSQEREEQSWGKALVNRQISGIKRAITELATELKSQETLKRMRSMEDSRETLEFEELAHSAGLEEGDDDVVALPGPLDGEETTAPTPGRRAANSKGTGRPRGSTGTGPAKASALRKQKNASTNVGHDPPEVEGGENEDEP